MGGVLLDWPIMSTRAGLSRSNARSLHLLFLQFSQSVFSEGAVLISW